MSSLIRLPKFFKKYVLAFAELYHLYKVDELNLVNRTESLFLTYCEEFGRISYLIGYLQAEKNFSKQNKILPKYKIIADNLTTLTIYNNYSEETLVKKPQEILFSKDYYNYSKEDIAKIAYLCGQNDSSEKLKIYRKLNI